MSTLEANSANWYANDELWQEFASVLFPPSTWEKAPEQVTQILKLVDTAPGAKVLDLCCGPGRHSLELARRGYGVTGVDRTRSYLEEARSRATAENLNADWIQSDMRDFVRPGAFDLALCCWTSFGYFEDPADDLRVLRNLHDSLRPGGKLLIDINGKEVIAHQFRVRDWSEVNGVILLEERKVASDWSRVFTRWIKFEDGRRAEIHFAVRPYSAVEIVQALKAAGFTEATAYGSMEGAAYDQNAKRLVVVARK